MAAFTDYLENALLNHVLRNPTGPAFARPASVWVALFNLATTDALTSGGIGQGEVSNSGTGYARQAVVFTDPTITPGQCANNADITFPTATAGWGTVTHIAIFDVSTYGSGNALFHGPLATPKTINTGDTFRFLTGQLIVGLD